MNLTEAAIEDGDGPRSASDPVDPDFCVVSVERFAVRFARADSSRGRLRKEQPPDILSSLLAAFALEWYKLGRHPRGIRCFR